MSLFSDAGVMVVSHYAPLHYLPFIARSKALLGKPSLIEAGFGQSHLRSMSSKQDISRGFGDVGFLTLDKHPRILAAKLKAGFPHIGIQVPESAFDNVEYALSRFNIAMTRYLRRNGKPGFSESETNGRYYPGKQIPVAVTDADKSAMLSAFVGSDTMIEVLVSGDLHLPGDTTIVCFSDEDLAIAQEILGNIGVTWNAIYQSPPGVYNRKDSYAQAVEEFVARALEEPGWRGNGLEFDRV